MVIVKDGKFDATGYDDVFSRLSLMETMHLLRPQQAQGKLFRQSS
jgi:hypothetical protein